jgi:hypothetical protein
MKNTPHLSSKCRPNNDGASDFSGWGERAQKAGYRFRLLLLDGCGKRQVWRARTVAETVDPGAWFAQAHAVRALLPVADSPDLPAFAFIRTGPDCLVVVAIPGGLVAGILDFDCAPALAAEALWEMVMDAGIAAAA